MRRFRTPPPCGTYSGYDYHVRQEEKQPCTPCHEAMKLHWRQKRAERGPTINAVRSIWRQNEQYHRSANNRRLLKGAKQEPYTYQDVLNQYGNDCHLCEQPIDLTAPRATGVDGWEQGLHIDHVIALSKGGDDTIANVRPSHGKCNILKSAKDPNAFIKEIRKN